MTGNFLTRFLRDESGPTAAEYAALLALIVLVLIAAVTSVGGSTSSIWINDVNQIQQVTGTASMIVLEGLFP